MNEFIPYKLRPVFHGYKYIILNLHFWGGWNSKGRSIVLLRTMTKVRKIEKLLFKGKKTVEATGTSGAKTLEWGDGRELMIDHS